MAERLAAALRGQGEVKVVPYLMAGFPGAEACLRAARSLAESGAAALELGIPFSDPLADGPLIQRAGQVALNNGMTTEAALELAGQVASATQLPVVLMAYANTILAHGPDSFASEAAALGVAGVIVPDLPPDESTEVRSRLEAVGLDTIFFVTPTSTAERLRLACELSSGFVYCVTVTGTTGVRTGIPDGLRELLARVRRATDLPVAAGFGISAPDQVASLRGMVDAVVVGSAVIKEQERGADPGELVRALVSAGRPQHAP